MGPYKHHRTKNGADNTKNKSTKRGSWSFFFFSVFFLSFIREKKHQWYRNPLILSTIALKNCLFFSPFINSSYTKQFKHPKASFFFEEKNRDWWALSRLKLLKWQRLKKSCEWIWESKITMIALLIMSLRNWT